MNLSFFLKNYQPNRPIHEPCRPDFFTGRSTNQAPQPSYRSNLPGLFLDLLTQITHHQWLFYHSIKPHTFNTPLQYRRSHPQAPIVPVKHRSISLLVCLCEFVCVWVCLCVDLSAWVWVWVCLCASEEKEDEKTLSLLCTEKREKKICERKLIK